MKHISHVLALALVLALPVLGLAAEKMTVVAQQAQAPYGGMPDQPQGQPPQGWQKNGRQQGQPQGQMQGQQQGQLPPGGMQGQPQGQMQGQQPGQLPPGGMQGQPQGQMMQGQQPYGGGPGMRQPQPPVVQPPVMVAPPGYGQQGRHQNRQAKALMRCNQRQASCAQNCNYRTYGRTRNMCNNQCNAVFVDCTTRANMR